MLRVGCSALLLSFFFDWLGRIYCTALSITAGSRVNNLYLIIATHARIQLDVSKHKVLDEIPAEINKATDDPAAAKTTTTESSSADATPKS